MKIIKTSDFKYAIKNEVIEFKTKIELDPMNELFGTSKESVKTDVTAYIEVERGIGELREPGGILSEPKESNRYYLLRIVDDTTGEEYPIEEYEDEIMNKFKSIVPDYI